LVLLIIAWSGVAAQVSIPIPQSNIQSGVSYTSTQNSGSLTGTLIVGPTIKLSGSSPILLQTSTGSSFPVTNLGIQLSTIGGINLISGSSPIQLSTTAQTIYSSVASVGGGVIALNYTIPAAGYAWVAGTYTTSLTYSLTSVLGGVVSPGLLTITIPAFIVAPVSISTVTLNVNSLNYYSSQTVSASSSLAYSTTVPYNISIAGNSANFTYSNTLGLSTPSNLAISNVLSNVGSGANVNLSSTAKSLTASPISVSNGNNQTQTLNFSITPASLLSQFVQTGTYTVPITLTTSDARSSPTVANQTTTSTLTVNVADMLSFAVNDATTTMTLSTATNYQNGVNQSQSNHLTVSSTSPWSIKVQAASGNLANGSNTIPVSYVSIGNTSGQSLLTTTTLSASAQTITSGQAPAINQAVGVNYSISAANAQLLISKPSGTYSTALTYTLSAL